MRREHISDVADALDYLTDCTLATVTDLAMKKSRSQYEFKRQTAIAQTGVDQMRRFGVTPTGRAADVKADFGGSVEKWAEQFDVKRSLSRSTTPSTEGAAPEIQGDVKRFGEVR